ncbi:hypothetical protein [Streptomyces sp. C]|uniref:hypothetical protein n=1 Tax=Streptomyces sp. C TaxID=253839 RepID=UPI0001B4F27D|nr:hypothetical protein [Streptomyces sp. C]EFL19889.1 predicted protein [Streptomyces sp. C]
MLTREPLPAAGGPEAPFSVRYASRQDAHLLHALVMKHRRACADLSSCRDAEALADQIAAGALGKSSRIWVLCDASSGWVVAAAYAEVRLDADGTGRLLVRGVVADPAREGDRPRELLVAWLTHWSSRRPSRICEIRVQVDCPMARARGSGKAVISSRERGVDGFVQQVDVRAPQPLPALASMVAAVDEPSAGGLIEVLPVGVNDYEVVAQFLQREGGEGVPEDYTRPPAPASGWLLLKEGRLAAVFTLRRNPARRPGWRGGVEEAPALRLERLQVAADDRRRTLERLTEWAGDYAANWHLAVLEAPVTEPDLVRHLEDLHWRASALRTTPSGHALVWVMQRRHQCADPSGNGTAP